MLSFALMAKDPPRRLVKRLLPPSMTRVSVPEKGVESLFGTHDENLRLLEKAFDVRIHGHGTELTIEGEERGTTLARRALEQLTGLDEGRLPVGTGDVRLAADLLSRTRTPVCKDYLLKSAVRSGKKVVVPRSLNQRRYLEQIQSHDMVFGIGPAGTGKTYLAVAQAMAYLLDKEVSRVILARPAVEAGEKLGFLPGDLQQKVDPYLRPLYDALYDLLDFEKVERLFERNQIEVAPIAFMRGRTLSDAFVIIDEAQNTTTEQMKMVLTRVGPGSKVVVTGDITQIDLPSGRVSGLVEALSVLSGVEGIAFRYFDEKDVVRHRLVQSIILAYEAWGGEKPPRAVTGAGRRPRSRWWCSNRQRRQRVDAARLRRVLEGAGRTPPRRRARSPVVLAGDGLLRRLNREYRGQDRPTDVLSFPGEGGEAGLGDVVISVPTAARNARRQGHGVLRELDILALHGFLHVLGYDHESDDGTMDRLEKTPPPRKLGVAGVIGLEVLVLLLLAGLSIVPGLGRGLLPSAQAPAAGPGDPPRRGHGGAGLLLPRGPPPAPDAGAPGDLHRAHRDDGHHHVAGLRRRRPLVDARRLRGDDGLPAAVPGERALHPRPQRPRAGVRPPPARRSTSGLERCPRW